MAERRPYKTDVLGSIPSWPTAILGKGGSVVTINVGDVWINSATGKAVTVVQVTEQSIRLQTQSGFSYDYDYGQFLNEYRKGTVYA